MGEVYRAVRADDEYRKEVAIKLVRSGQDSSFVLSRFKNERQILASLDHPNIARLLDGGTTEQGVSYFVMELIEGEKINKYCDAGKLPTTDRLKLFLQVCSAVQYAHQHLVIHRDIKPGNILVTAEGVPKLLDFGIAKILESSDAADQPEQTIRLIRLLTPEYASPEQVKGEPITTASDVYSLGVVLYELLTGRTPYDVPNRTPHEISRAVCEAEPEKPSTAVRRKQLPAGNGESKGTDDSALSAVQEGSPEKLSKRLGGDLDNILLMALRKEPYRRYATVEQFAQDIRRHLNHLPVIARKDNAAYRASKFMTRHKAGVAAGVVVAVALIAGMLVTLREARIARANELRAERRLQQAQELSNSLIEELPSASSNGVTPARVLMNQKAVEYLLRMTQEESSDPKLTFDLARAYLRLGEAQANPGLSNVGDFKSAIDSYRHAISLFEKQLATDQANARIRLLLAHAYAAEGLALYSSDVQRSLQLHLKASAVLPPQNQPSDYWVEIERCQKIELVGERYGNPNFHNLGDTSHALENIRKAIDLAEMLYRKENPELQDTVLLSSNDFQMAGILWARGNMKEALEYQSRGEALLNSTWAPTGAQRDDFSLQNWAPNVQQLREKRGMAMVRRANLLAEDGQVTEAQAVLRDSRGMLERLFWKDPMNYRVRRDLTQNYNLTAHLLARTGDLRAALDMYHKALPLTTEVLAVQPNQPDIQQHLADTYEGIGNTLAAMGKNSEAFANSRKAVDLRESLAKLDPNNARYRFSLAKNYVSLGDVLARAHRRADAISNYRLAVGIEKSLAVGDPFNALVARDLAATKRKLHALSTPDQANHH